jgi:hypothetical protein
MPNSSSNERERLSSLPPIMTTCHIFVNTSQHFIAKAHLFGVLEDTRIHSMDAGKKNHFFRNAHKPQQEHRHTLRDHGQCCPLPAARASARGAAVTRIRLHDGQSYSPNPRASPPPLPLQSSASASASPMPSPSQPPPRPTCRCFGVSRTFTSAAVSLGLA